MWEIGLLLLTGGLSVAIRETYRNQRLRLQILQDTAQLCGLRVESTSRPFLDSLRIKARSGPTTVWIEDAAEGSRKLHPQIRVEVPGPPGFSGVRIRREAERPPGAREVEIGDERFDSTFYVEGPTRLLSVLLDAETRRLLVRVNAEGRLAITGGEIRIKTSDKDVETLLPLLLDLTRRFSEEVDIAQRLAENAREDPTAGVRLRNLLFLIREFPGEPGTLETLRAACSDASAQVRLRAAMALGAESRDVLVALAESQEDDACGAQAIAHLGRDLPVERTRALLVQALRRRHLQMAHACLEALGRSSDAADVEVLAKVLMIEKGELAAAAALALGATGSPAAEPPLLLALQHEKAEIRVTAATALGRAGSAAAVLPLKKAAERHPRDEELRRATRQAIAGIQSRLQGASPGQLSLAVAKVGQLSLAQAEAGQLSFATDSAGQLSLPPEADQTKMGS
ncbi:MAG TPA: HEAT repeat domain-containing protein [Thermoanaerobaculia bacterium]|nr:HEAT repeat domain-containing protein [Thermoanaerobaculia bacterium]